MIALPTVRFVRVGSILSHSTIGITFVIPLSQRASGPADGVDRRVSKRDGRSGLPTTGSNDRQLQKSPTQVSQIVVLVLARSRVQESFTDQKIGVIYHVLRKKMEKKEKHGQIKITNRVIVQQVNIIVRYSRGSQQDVYNVKHREGIGNEGGRFPIIIAIRYTFSVSIHCTHVCITCAMGFVRYRPGLD